MYTYSLYEAATPMQAEDRKTDRFESWWQKCTSGLEAAYDLRHFGNRDEGVRLQLSLNIDVIDQDTEAKNDMEFIENMNLL